MTVASAPKPRRNGVVAAAGRGTARLVLYPVRAGLRSSAGAEARRELEDAAVDALAAPEVEHLVDRLLAGPFPEAVARSIVDNHVAERVVREALKRADLEAAITSALQSEEADALVERTFQTPAFRRALEETLASPAVRAALVRQGSDATQDALGRLRSSLEKMDDSLERGPRRWFGRPARAARPAEAGFATRGFALVIDAAGVNLAFLAGVALVALVASLAGGLPTWIEAVLSGVGFAIAVAVYFVFFWSVSGSTPGMALVRVRVLTTDGQPLGPGRAFIRLAGLLLSIAIAFLGFLPALVSDRRRALQDDLAGTVVVREARGA
jgi:uncharacterized RDD family membrane protein YckC